MKQTSLTEITYCRIPLTYILKKKKKQNYTENDKGFVREKGEWEVDYKGAAWENLGEFLFNTD